MSEHNNQQVLRQRGYIALMTAILLSMALLILVVAVSFEGFASRFTILESTQKEQSDFLAEACVATARLKIAQNIDYHLSANFPETVPVEKASCEIYEITNGSQPDWRIIKARGQSGEAVTNLEVEVDASALPVVRIDSWEEVAMF